MIIVLSNQIRTSIQLYEISEVFAFGFETTTCQRRHGDIPTKQLSLSSKYCTLFETHCLIGRNLDAIIKYKYHLNTISNEKLSDPLWDSRSRSRTQSYCYLLSTRGAGVHKNVNLNHEHGLG